MVKGLGLRASRFGFPVSDLVLRVSGFGFRVPGSGPRVSLFGIRDSACNFRDQEFTVQGLELACRIQGIWENRVWAGLSGNEIQFETFWQ